VLIVDFDSVIVKIRFGLFYRVRVLRFFVVDLVRFNRRQLRRLLIVFRLKDVNVEAWTTI